MYFDLNQHSEHCKEIDTLLIFSQKEISEEDLNEMSENIIKLYAKDTVDDNFIYVFIMADCKKPEDIPSYLKPKVSDYGILLCKLETLHECQLYKATYCWLEAVKAGHYLSEFTAQHVVVIAAEIIKARKALEEQNSTTESIQEHLNRLLNSN